MPLTSRSYKLAFVSFFEVPALQIHSESQPAGAHRKGERTAERILDAAEVLFAQRGFAGTTLRDVASVVGLRIPSLYNHFPSKEALYAAVLERGLRPVLEVLMDLVGSSADAELGAAAVERVVEILSLRPELPRLMQYEALSGGEHLSPMLREWIRPLFARAAQLIDSSPSAEPWSEEETPLLVLALYNVILGYFTIAPLYQHLNDEDLLAPSARRRQARFLAHLVGSLFPTRVQPDTSPRQLR